MLEQVKLTHIHTNTAYFIGYAAHDIEMDIQLRTTVRVKVKRKTIFTKRMTHCKVDLSLNMCVVALCVLSSWKRERKSESEEGRERLAHRALNVAFLN